MLTVGRGIALGILAAAITCVLLFAFFPRLQIAFVAFVLIAVAFAGLMKFSEAKPARQALFGYALIAYVVATPLITVVGILWALRNTQSDSLP